MISSVNQVTLLFSNNKNFESSLFCLYLKFGAAISLCMRIRTDKNVSDADHCKAISKSCWHRYGLNPFGASYGNQICPQLAGNSNI